MPTPVGTKPIPHAESTNGPNWIANTGWNQTDTPCSWYGVECRGGHVNKITLDNNQLKGSLSDLNALTHLQLVYLNNNQLSGSLPNLEALTSLRRLDLQNNQLSGSLPDFSALTSLQSLDLYNNQFSGALPDFSALTHLSSLNLGFNQFSGLLPDFFSKLTNLYYLNLENNQFNGSLPDFSTLAQLRYLYLSWNQFNGSLPDLSTLIYLRELSLSNNQFTGSLPDFSALTSLQRLHLHNNQLSGSLPDFSALTHLQTLYLHNNQLCGEIPPSLTTLNLTSLWVKNNHLTALDPALIELLNLKDPGWEITQTPCTPTLTIKKAGNGSGTILAPAGLDSGINCGIICSETYPNGSYVMLTVTPDSSSIFVGWTGSSCADSIFINNDNLNCTATFELVSTAVLTLTVAGKGQISGPHLSCTQAGGECAAEYSQSETVTLTATGLGTWNFKEWQGDCAGTTNPLPVLMNQSKHCTAIFEPGLWVGLVDFSATGLASTVLQWQTASEIDTVGFQLWQAQAKEGNCQDYVNYTEVTRLTDSLVESQGAVMEGASYSYNLPTISPGSCYGLEAVDSHGSSTFYLIGLGIQGWLEVVD